ncbi:MAG: BLUF domain-containing protein [Steroidobacterales bacterium]
MIRLLYLSQATPGISDEQVQDILLSSQRNNAAAGISGVLVNGGGTAGSRGGSRLNRQHSLGGAERT